MVGVIAHQQRGLAVRHVEGNCTANAVARVQRAGLQHGSSGTFYRGLEEPASLVEDLEVVRVVVDRAGGAGEFYLDPEVTPRSWWQQSLLSQECRSKISWPLPSLVVNSIRSP